MPFNFIQVATYAGIIVVGLLIMGLIFARLYKRASKEISFVRTGFGGQKVIMNGGALVFPVLHEVIPVNMNTLRLAVHRANEQALITRESAKPMKAIDDIKIIQLDGLSGVTSAGDGNGAANGNLADNVVASALKYRAQAPLIDSLMAEVGLKGEDLNGLTQAFKSVPPQAKPQNAAE